MARKKSEAGGRRLLDAWLPPADAGEPIGCIATTFTFDPIFFEEHCVARFLRMETDPREDGAAYLIEREEKLSAIRVSVLVDRSQADGSASPRWDVLPIQVAGGGLFHPKIFVLGWQNAIRLIIGSANLTEPAFRKNQEVVGALDFVDGGTVPLNVLSETLRFLESASVFAHGNPESGPKARLRELIRRLSFVSDGWSVGKVRRNDSVEIAPILLAPLDGYQTPVLERLGQLVRSGGGPARAARVISPFFDKAAGKTYGPTIALLNALSERGDRSVEFFVPTEDAPDGRVLVRAPWSLLRAGKKAANFSLSRTGQEDDGEFRPLHAKVLWLWSDRWDAYCVGSSNFTSAGLGLAGASSNVEANLVYQFAHDRSIVRTMEETMPPTGDKIDDLDAVIWEPLNEDDGEGVGGTTLPLGFEEALFEPAAQGGVLMLRFGEKLPAEWTILAGPEGPVLYAAEKWHDAGRPSEARLAWADVRLPTTVLVRWRKDLEALSAPWPVNVTDHGLLPPPEELRDLPLETLVEILGSRLPLYEAVLRARARQSVGLGADTLPFEIDPHRRVNTETFLLQRTKRVAAAVEQLVQRLSRPVVHEDALLWRLRGPVGPLALARALQKAAQSPGEACFLLSEVALALRRVRVEKMAFGIPEETVKRAIEAVREEVAAMARERMESHDVPAALAEYVTKVLAVGT